MIRYKDILVAKGSKLYDAILSDKKEPKLKLAEKAYKETSSVYAAIYSKEDRDWFANKSKQ